MKISMLDLKILSKENLNKVHAVLKTIDVALEIGKSDNGTLLIPKTNFEEQHVHISEVVGVLAKIAKAENNLIVVVPHEIPHPPDKRHELPPYKSPPSLINSPLFPEEGFEHKQARYERDNKVYEETYSKNIELRVKDDGKFRKLLRKVKDSLPDVKEQKKISLGSHEVIFIEEDGSIKVGDRVSPLPPQKNEHDLCRVMFKHSVDTPVDWSVIYQQMAGSEPVADKKYARSVQDAMYAVNKRIQKDINTDDSLFSWENKSIRRNY